MKSSLILFVATFCLACDGSTPVIEPEKKISREIMEDIFYDLTVMKSVQNSNDLNEEFKSYLGVQYIYEKYGIDSLQLIQNQMYYVQKPKLMKKIFQNLEVRYLNIQDSLDTLIKNEHKN
tara:strand:- start:16065 stop:16424 length:360 start_codon:yes stop_codon:yes gene_type:complete